MMARFTWLDSMFEDGFEFISDDESYGAFYNAAPSEAYALGGSELSILETTAVSRAVSARRQADYQLRIALALEKIAGNTAS